jgi:hypothetical protein
MQFITILETNHKERESFLHYCQWTGNEDELTKLLKVIDLACYDDMCGDYSDFWYSRALIRESAVDEHVQLKEYGSYCPMFQKHVGVFTCPEFDVDDCEKDGDMAARILDDTFYGCRLKEYFRNA